MIRAAVTLLAVVIATPATAFDRFRTYCNPVDLPYRFQDGVVVRRSAADPTLLRYHGEWWLFPSKSHGYFRSSDLIHWTVVTPTGYPAGKWAPTVVEVGDAVYLTAGEDERHIYVADDLAAGRWHAVGDMGRPFYDPDLFADDGRLFVYHGLSDAGPLSVTELDPATFKPLRTVETPAARAPAARGWEVAGDANDRSDLPTWIEGSWMTKVGERYFLEFAAPGTEYRAYAGGVLVADSPLGPFAYQIVNPFAVKPTGFISGAGHGSTAAGADGRLWHVGSMTISVRDAWERRVGLWPAEVTPSGTLVADTYLGDWPHTVDGVRGLAGWMLLSRGKPATASSSAAGHGPELAADDNVRTWWSATGSGPDEWFRLDLGGRKRIEALQINFADDGAVGDAAGADVFRYVAEVSRDGRRWRTVVDHSAQGRDSPHDYEVLPRAVTGRFVRVRNVHSPYGARFSLYDLRVFGSADTAAPAAVAAPTAVRDAADPRHATVTWPAASGAIFYVVRLGAAPDAMNQNWQVYDGATRLAVASLDRGTGYWLAVDAVNERGIMRGAVVRMP